MPILKCFKAPRLFYWYLYGNINQLFEHHKSNFQAISTNGVLKIWLYNFPPFFFFFTFAIRQRENRV